MARFSKLSAEFKRALEKAIAEISKTQNMRIIGATATEMIKTRTRLGYGVEDAGKKRKKLKGLSPNYVETRRADDELSEFTTPKRSNLTRTGQMLESLSVTSASVGHVEIGASGSRKDGKKNSEIAGYVSEAGRPFNALSDIEQKRIEDQILRDLEKAAEQRLTNIK